ncbi:MAG: ATP-binding cassette domain-containing protein [Phycisphaerae bacterium]|nr:ATP-binding cassette domain-containing protein [Phycisphaerae bacterium]
MATPAIDMRGVRKTFGPKVAVDDLDLAVPAGTLVGLIGPNGAGKTTAIRMVMSIIFPDRGDIRVLGRASAVESKDRIGYLPEERGLYKKMKVGPFLKYVARLKGVDDAGLETKVRGWLERLGLSDCYRKKSEELSKGMQQKVQFIASVIHEPDLLILDEPFSGLDPVNSRLLRQLIDEQHRAGRTIVFSTHQMSQAEALCDRIVMIHRGRKVLDNTPGEIRSRFDPRSVAFEPADGFDAAALRAMPEVAGVHEGRSMIEARLRDGVDAAGMIPRLASSFRVRRIEVVRPSLEDVFIEIVQGEGASEEEREALMAMVRADRATSDAGGD